MYSKEFVNELSELFDRSLEYVIERHKGGLTDIIGYCADVDKPDEIVTRLNEENSELSVLFTYRENPEYSPASAMEFVTILCTTLKKVGPALLNELSLRDIATYYSKNKEE